MNAVTLSRGELLNRSLPNFTLQVNIFVLYGFSWGAESLGWLALLSEQCAYTRMVMASWRQLSACSCLKKITVAFVQAAFEQVHCENKIAVGREHGM